MCLAEPNPHLVCRAECNGANIYTNAQSKSALLPASEQDGGADMFDAHPQDDALDGPDDAPL